MKVPAVLAFVCVVGVLLAPTASAANGTLTVSPNPAVVGDPLVFSGCGYTPGQDVQVQAVHNTKIATYILQQTEFVDATGCFSTANEPYIAPDAGKWTANAFDYNTGQKVAATLNFFVG